MDSIAPRGPQPKKTLGPKTILKIIGIYALFGAVWVSCSDILVFLHGGETVQAAVMSISKGLLFVAVSAVLLYAIISSFVRGTVVERDTFRERLRNWNLDANDIVWLLDEEGRVLEVNDRAIEAYGFTETGLCQKTLSDLLTDKAGFQAQWASLLQEGSLRLEAVHRRADGTTFPIEFSARRFDIDGSIFIHGIGRDITERRAAERQLMKLKDAYAALSQTNQCINKCCNRDELFQQTCEIAIQYTHLKLAWIGMIEPSHQNVVLVAKAGDAIAYAEDLQVSTNPASDWSRGPAGRAILTGAPAITNDLWKSEGFQPWTSRLLTYGLTSWAAFPLFCDGQVAGVLTLYSDDPQFFTTEVTGLLKEMSDDLSLALERLASKAKQAALEAELKKLRMAVEQSPVTVMISDTSGSIQYVNPAFTETSGYSAGEALGKNPRILRSGETLPEEYALMWQRLIRGEAWTGLFHNKRKDGSLYWEEAVISPVKDSRGAITHYIAVKQDVTARKEAEAKAHFLAFHDPLTELPNRIVAKSEMAEAMLLADRTGGQAALLFIDVDNFKRVNDSLGHAVGDRLLKAVVDRLTSGMRAGDALSRISGDEFLIVARGIHSVEAIAGVAERIRKSLSSPLVVDGMEIVTTVSIGAAVYPDDGLSFEELHRRADLAMYSAKREGRDAFRIYTKSMETDAHEYVLTVNGLRKALEHGEFVLHYQPQVHLKTGNVEAVEALIRWNHPELGLVPPGKFIPIAEDSRLIIEIGKWVIKEACRQAASWRESGLADLRVAINISALQLRRGDFEHVISAAMRESTIGPGLLEIELTESALIHDKTNAAILLKILKGLGVHVALDDFGTGYSNFIYLRHFNLDRLKIDQSFIRNVTSSKGDVAIVRSIVQVARNFGLETVAEGVETEECLKVVRRAGCDLAQGFLLAKPMPAEAVLNFILKRRESAATPESAWPESDVHPRLVE